MNIELDQGDESVLVRLSGEASIRDARCLHAKLSEACLSNDGVNIDAAQLTSLDTAIIQLLIATRHSHPKTSLKLPGDHEVRTTIEQSGALAALLAPDDSNHQTMDN